MPYPYSPGKSEMHKVYLNGKSYPVWEHDQDFYSTFDPEIIKAVDEGTFEYYYADPDEKWSRGSSKEFAVMAAMITDFDRKLADSFSQLDDRIQESENRSAVNISDSMAWITRD